MAKKAAPPDKTLLAKKVKVNASYDVGLGGSSTKDGETVLIDRSIYAKLKALKVGDRTINAVPFLVVHEKVEKQLEDLGWDYTDAHNYAEKLEHKELHRVYPDIKDDEYEAAWKPLLIICAKKKESRVHKNMELKPYEHPHSKEQRRLLKEAA